MEINVTIFIQALIFLMLFLFSSKLLFNPLDEVYTKRRNVTNNEECQISIIKSSINEQKYYLAKIIFLLENKIRRKNTYITKYQNLKKRKYEKIINIRNSEKYKNITFQLQNEFGIAKNKILRKKIDILRQMLKKFDNN